MSKSVSFYETIDHIITYGVRKEILHLYNEDEGFNGNEILLRGRKVVNFGSCSYLGLEFDERLREGAKGAIDRYGTQFSESRAYVSLKLYKDLEEAVEQIFGNPVVITPTTTLGHIANIPVLIGDDDAVIIDHQVHSSVQTAINLVKARGVYTELIRHNRMDLLEERVKALRSKYKKIWYTVDGVYSMFGDGCPLDEVYALMNTYPQLRLYLDDAHGMSIYGKHGRGYALRDRDMHPHMVMATSLNKAFASGGGALIYPDRELARKVRTCGGPLITSGPMQPSTLGAAVASARIHLSPEITGMQEELHERIRFARLMLKKYQLPVVSQSGAAVFFIGVSLPKLGYNMVRRMLDAGYYVNLGIFPAVPMKQTGIRFTLTRLHTFRQIEEMIAAMARAFPLALAEEGMCMEEIYKAFRMTLPEEAAIDRAVETALTQSLSLRLEHHKTIDAVDGREWDGLFQGKGTFDVAGLQTLERAFAGNELPEDNWAFDYLIVRDREGKPVVASFLTTTLWKDDMLAPAGVSGIVEEQRRTDPYYLTTQVTSVGSLLTEGEHLYIDRSSRYWKEALQLFIEKAYALQEQYRSGNVIFRDFQGQDELLDGLMVDNGFFRIAMPDAHLVPDLGWKDKGGFYESLSTRSKQHYREDVRKHEGKYTVSLVTEHPGEATLDAWYELYRNVKNHSLELNTFDLPRKLFSEMFTRPGWEALVLSLKAGYADPGRETPVCVVFCYPSGATYVPMIIGMDYAHNREFKIYRQALYQLVMRAKARGAKRLSLGFAATVEKKKVGAKPIPTHAYMHSRDSFNMEVVAALKEKAYAYAR